MRVYEILVDRFSTGSSAKDAALRLKTSNARIGGNLNGVIKKLDYVKDLGFDAIWLTPIFVSDSYHGYSLLDLHSIDRHFGSDKILYSLVKKAHSLGIKVILDFVPNHVSSRHRFFTSARKNPRSRYKDWFFFDEKTKDYMHFLGMRNLVKLNTMNQDVINYLIEAALYWIKNFDIDGYRLDHAIGPSMTFWNQFTKECRSAREDFLLLPELWTAGIAPQYMNTLWALDDKTLDMLRPVLEKNRDKQWDQISEPEGEKLALSAMKNMFSTSINFVENFYLRKAARSGEVYKPTFEKDFIFADNHDMQRISWITGGDRERVGKAVTSISRTSNSIVYYGTEIGLNQKRDFSKYKTAPDVECRRFMDWKASDSKAVSDFKTAFRD